MLAASMTGRDKAADEWEREFGFTKSAIPFEFSSSPGGTRPCCGKGDSSLEDILKSIRARVGPSWWIVVKC